MTGKTARYAISNRGNVVAVDEHGHRTLLVDTRSVGDRRARKAAARTWIAEHMPPTNPLWSITWNATLKGTLHAIKINITLKI